MDLAPPPRGKMPGLAFEELDTGIHSAHNFGPTWASGHSPAKTKRAITTRLNNTAPEQLQHKRGGLLFAFVEPWEPEGLQAPGRDTQPHSQKQHRERARLKATEFGRRGVHTEN